MLARSRFDQSRLRRRRRRRRRRRSTIVSDLKRSLAAGPLSRARNRPERPDNVDDEPSSTGHYSRRRFKKKKKKNEKTRTATAKTNERQVPPGLVRRAHFERFPL